MRLQRTAWPRFEDFSPKPSQTLERGREGFQGDVCSDSGSGVGRLRRGPCCLVARGQMACTERVTAAVTEPRKNHVLRPLPRLRASLWKPSPSLPRHDGPFLRVFPPGLKAYKSLFPVRRSAEPPGPPSGQVTDKSIWSDNCWG